MIDQPLIVWSEKLSLGLRELDDHHCQMISIINRLHKFKISTSAAKDVRMLLKEAIDYANRHFEAEEAEMRKVGYANMYEHHMAHQRYKKNVTRMAHENDANPARLSDSLFRYLKGWWLDHILTMDMQFAEVIRKRPEPMRWLW